MCVSATSPAWLAWLMLAACSWAQPGVAQAVNNAEPAGDLPKVGEESMLIARLHHDFSWAGFLGITLSPVQLVLSAEGTPHVFWPARFDQSDLNASVAVRTQQDGRWTPPARLTTEGPFQFYEVRRSQGTLTLVTISNERRVAAHVRSYEIPAALLIDPNGQDRRLSLSQEVVIDFRPHTAFSTDRFGVSNVLASSERADRLYLFGEYDWHEFHPVKFFLGGGHRPSYGRVCAWVYGVEGLGSLSTLVGQDYTSYRLPVPPVLGPNGTPWAVVEKENRDRVYYLVWHDGSQWRDKLLRTVRVQGKEPWESSWLKGFCISSTGVLNFLWRNVRQWGKRWVEREVDRLYVSQVRDLASGPDVLICEADRWIQKNILLSLGDSDCCIVWADGKAISYRVLRGSGLTRTESFPAKVSWALTAAADPEQNALHLVWTQRAPEDKDAVDRPEMCDIYYRELPLPR